MVHNSTMFDWDDLKYLLAVARHGSTLAAGRVLDVDQSTVQRRLVELERRIGQSLVQRHPTGYRLTEFGEQMLPFAERIEQAVLAFEHRLAAWKAEASGVIRMTCPEPLVYRITQAGLIDRFHALHPSIHVQFVMSDKYLDLAKGDADVALRSGDTEDGELVGRKIGDSIWAVYASRTISNAVAGLSASKTWMRMRWWVLTRPWLSTALPNGCGKWRQTPPWLRVAAVSEDCSPQSKRASAWGPFPLSWVMPSRISCASSIRCLS